MSEELIEQVARALAKSHGLDFDEVCGVDADPENGECDSGTCIAACYEDHDAAYARAMYRADARAILPLIEADRAEVRAELVREIVEALPQLLLKAEVEAALVTYIEKRWPQSKTEKGRP